MFRIDSSGAKVSLETPGAVGSTVGYFTEGNPGTGTLATKVSSDWLNAVQEELMNIVTAYPSAAGDKTSQAQAVKAIKYLANKFQINDVSSAAYTVLDTDDYSLIRMTTGASDRDLTLPTAAAGNKGRKVLVQKVDSGAGAVHFATAISGRSDVYLTEQWDYVMVQSNGSSWDVVSSHVVEYASNSGVGGTTAATTYTTGSTAGKAGSQFVNVNGNTASGAAITIYRVTFKNAHGDRDDLNMQTLEDGLWRPVETNYQTTQHLLRLGDAVYGLGIKAEAGGSVQSVHACFGNAGRLATSTYAAAGSDWSGVAGDATKKWRIRMIVRF